MLTIAHSIKTSFFASYYDISHGFALLPPLWCQFNMPIPIEHREKPVGCVSEPASLAKYKVDGEGTYSQTGVF
jgi:hypothetical protein